MTDLSNKVTWITGASSGIGEALAIEASRRGAKLVLSARREGELQRVRGLCADPARVAILPLDLTNFDATAAAASAAAAFGPVDILVNNAGQTQRSLLLDTDMAVYRHILELDFFAPVALAKAVLPSMAARGSGHVVTISSVAGKFGAAQRTGYCAAKHALHGFFDAARAELWRRNVRFTTVCPGYVKTNVSINAVTAHGAAHGQMDPGQARGMDPAVCARKIWYAVERDREEALVGGKEAAFVNLRRFFPALFSFIIKRAPAT
jgi:dehydrogenase/reductase SDR family protein 7B